MACAEARRTPAAEATVAKLTPKDSHRIVGCILARIMLRYKDMASIVIVDDNQDSARFLKRLLEFAGHAATWMPACEATVTALKQVRPDLLVLDVMMPQLSGIDLLRLLRQEPPLDNLAVVMLSGVMDLDVQAQAFELGALDYIVKDMDWESSLARIEQHLKKN